MAWRLSRPAVWFVCVYGLLVTVIVLQVKILDQVSWKQDHFRISHATATDRRSSCQQTCPQGRINKIFMLNNYRAGLLDREDSILWLVQLGGFLCAKVYVQTPYFSLEPSHNRNQEVDQRLKWSDFYNFDDTVLGEIDFADHYVPGSLLKNASHFRDKLAQSRMDISKHDVILSKSVDDIVRDFGRLVNATIDRTASTPWIWGINKVFWHFFREVNAVVRSTRDTFPYIDGIPTICDYVGDAYYSTGVQQVVQSIVRDVEDHYRPEHWGVLHIRRSDTESSCDTSIKRMASFLQCSFRDTQGQIVVLFSTDEQDPAYRQAIMGLLEKEHVASIDLDAVVERHVQSFPSYLQSNYMIFAIELAVRKMAPISFELEQRRQLLCPNCVNVRQMLDAPSPRKSLRVTDTLMDPNYHAVIRKSKKKHAQS